MAVKDWNPGQLAVLWIGVVLGVALFAWLGLALLDEASGPSFCFGPCPEPTRAERIMTWTGLGLLVLCFTAVLSMLVLTWKWFAARRR